MLDTTGQITSKHISSSFPISLNYIGKFSQLATRGVWKTFKMLFFPSRYWIDGKYQPQATTVLVRSTFSQCVFQFFFFLILFGKLNGSYISREQLSLAKPYVEVTAHLFFRYLCYDVFSLVDYKIKLKWTALEHPT